MDWVQEASLYLAVCNENLSGMTFTKSTVKIATIYNISLCDHINTFLDLKNGCRLQTVWLRADSEAQIY